MATKQTPIYQPAMALDFFKAAGKPARAAPGASATAETDCQLLPINRQGFLALVKTSPEFASALLASLARRLTTLNSKLK